MFGPLRTIESHAQQAVTRNTNTTNSIVLNSTTACSISWHIVCNLITTSLSYLSDRLWTLACLWEIRMDQLIGSVHLHVFAPSPYGWLTWNSGEQLAKRKISSQNSVSVWGARVHVLWGQRGHGLWWDLANQVVGWTWSTSRGCPTYVILWFQVCSSGWTSAVLICSGGVRICISAWFLSWDDELELNNMPILV